MQSVAGGSTTGVRPEIITAVCVVLGIAIALNIVSIAILLNLAGSAALVSPGRFAWIVTTTALGAASVVGLWRMRWWGPLLYLGGQAVEWATSFIWPPRGMQLVPGPASLLVDLAILLLYAGAILPYRKRLQWLL